VVPTTTTAPTPTTQPQRTTYWRLYVRITLKSNNPHDVNVPLRSTDAAVVVNLTSAQLVAFQIGDQMTTDEIASVGDDIVGRFEKAAQEYITGHLADYPDFAGIDGVHWVMRVASAS
jgi:hypothetical protein